MTRRDWIRLVGLVPLGAGLRAAERRRVITVENFDAARLGAAIFAASNQARAGEKRSKLLPLAALDAAAADQAGTMAARLRPSHEGPFAGSGDALARVKLAGLTPEIVAENVSAISLPPPESGETWADDYALLAAEVVREWMQSPGHRRNLLRREVTHLGCAARLARTPMDPARVFSVQVFFRPKDERWKPFAGP
jgi:uncharacterized protein YkwD